MAHFKSFGQCHPLNFEAIVTVFPYPKTRIRKLLVYDQWLRTAVTCLVQCSFWVLHEGRSFLAKRSFLHSLAVDIVLVRLYSSTTNLSIDAEWLVISSNFGSNDILEKEVVSSPKWFHVFHAAFFPLPTKNETWSHPVNAWKSGRHFDFSGLRAAVILRISIYWKWFPVPIASQSSNKSSCPNKPIDIATTSASTMPISTFFMPDWLASFACSNILLSASSWFEGAINDRSQFPLVIAEFPMLFIMVHWISIVMHAGARKLKSSCLFSSKRKNECQFPGIFESWRTLLLVPVPLLVRVLDFRLFEMYSTHTISILVESFSCS